jgi:hypothetical protein
LRIHAAAARGRSSTWCLRRTRGASGMAQGKVEGLGSKGGPALSPCSKQRVGAATAALPSPLPLLQAPQHARRLSTSSATVGRATLAGQSLAPKALDIASQLRAAAGCPDGLIRSGDCCCECFHPCERPRAVGVRAAAVSTVLPVAARRVPTLTDTHATKESHTAPPVRATRRRESREGEGGGAQGTHRMP